MDDKGKCIFEQSQNMKLDTLTIYPIKSTAPIHLTESEVNELGLKHDRQWGVFDSTNKIMTGRDFPQLLDVSCVFDGIQCQISYQHRLVGTFKIFTRDSATEDLQIHSYMAFGKKVNPAIDAWLTDLLGQSAHLREVDNSRIRPVLAKHGGNDGDRVAFADQAPVLLMGTASLEDLNQRLKDQIGMDRFRPNLIIKTTEPHVEDSWEIIEIGNVPFRVIQQCERCVFTTIDTASKKKHPRAEPLRTLAQYRIGPRGGVVLGVHAVPLKSGVIKKNDPLKVITSVNRSVKVK